MRSFSRADRVGKRIREDVAALLTTRINDPLLKSATITGVKLTQDLMLARVYYCISGDQEQKEAVAGAFARATGFIKRELAASLAIKHMPQIEFLYDETVERGKRIDALLREAAASMAPEPPVK